MSYDEHDERWFFSVSKETLQKRKGLGGSFVLGCIFFFLAAVLQGVTYGWGHVFTILFAELSVICLAVVAGMVLMLAIFKKEEMNTHAVMGEAMEPVEEKEIAG